MTSASTPVPPLAASELNLRRGFRRLGWVPILLALVLGLALRVARENGMVSSDLVYWGLAILSILAALVGWVAIRLVGFVVIRAKPRRISAGAAVDQIEALAGTHWLTRFVMSLSGPLQTLLMVARFLRSIERGDLPEDLASLGRWIGAAAAVVVVALGLLFLWNGLTLARVFWLVLAGAALGAVVFGLIAWAAAGFRKG